MMCNTCLSNPCRPGCPNYEAPHAFHHCCICDDGIYDGEEYIINDAGEYRHIDCYQGMKELLSWLGHDIKTMEETDERNY